MKSALSMQVQERAVSTARLVALIAVALSAGCSKHRLYEPAFLEAPYARTQVWAVAPLMNESGASYADGFRFADALAQQAQDVGRINVIPVNRVILAMRELDMPRITGPADARMLIASLGVDGLIVGTITAYNPYRPMTLGAAIELHLADRAMRQASPGGESGEVDIRQLSRSPTSTESFAAGGLGKRTGNPVAQAAGIFDATNHRTLAQMNAYAKGRNVPDSAYGRDIYLVSMDMYTQFVSFQLLHDLLEGERLRIAPEKQEVASSTR